MGDKDTAYEKIKGPEIVDASWVISQNPEVIQRNRREEDSESGANVCKHNEA